MIINFNVDNPKSLIRQFHEICLPGYYGTDAVISDLNKVLEFHQMKWDKYKTDYINKWGIAKFKELILNSGYHPDDFIEVK